MEPERKLPALFLRLGLVKAEYCLCLITSITLFRDAPHTPRNNFLS